MSKELKALEILLKYSDLKIINNSTTLKKVAFFYKSVLVEARSSKEVNLEDYIIHLETTTNQTEKILRKNITTIKNKLDFFYNNEEQLDIKDNSDIFCVFVYAAVRLNIIKNDDENGLLAIYE